jgi:hypothetical protein
MAFRSLRDMFPGWLDVCLVELPGRGIRVQEELETNMDRLVHSLVRELVPLLTDSSFALYGHSMGALIAYRLAHELRDEHGLDASALLVSGARAPHLARPPDMLHELPDSQLISRLQRMEGTEAALFRNRELRELMLNIVRADFQMLETSEPAEIQPLACPIHAFGGEVDAFVNPEDVEGWRFHTDADFRTTFYPGGHFFIRENAGDLVREMMTDLQRCFASGRRVIPGARSKAGNMEDAGSGGEGIHE